MNAEHMKQNADMQDQAVRHDLLPHTLGKPARTQKLQFGCSHHLNMLYIGYHLRHQAACMP